MTTTIDDDLRSSALECYAAAGLLDLRDCLNKLYALHMRAPVRTRGLFENRFGDVSRHSDDLPRFGGPRPRAGGWSWDRTRRLVIGDDGRFVVVPR